MHDEQPGEHFAYDEAEFGRVLSTQSASALIFHFSERLIGVPVQAIDGAIEAMLHGLARYLGAAGCYVVQALTDEERLLCTHRWVDGERPVPEWDVAMDRMEWMRERLHAVRFVAIADPADLPPEASYERQWLADAACTSLAVASVEMDDGQTGYLIAEGGDDLEREEVAFVLRQVGMLLSGALRRQASEQRYQTLFEKAGAPILVIRPDDETILDANPAAAHVYGVPRPQLLGRSLKAFTADVERGETFIERLLTHGAVENFETVHRRVDGEPVRMLVSCASIQYKGETAVLCFFSDISAQKAVEDQLRESEQRWRSLVENHPETIMISVDGKIRYINEAGVKTLGASDREEVIGRSIVEQVPPEERERMLARRARLEAGQETGPFEHRLIRLDGAERIAESYSTPIRYGGTPAAQTVIRDVTEQRMAEQRFRALLESAPDAMVIVNEEGRIVLVNKQAECLFGYTRDELEGERLSLLLPERFRAAHDEHFQQFFDTPQVHQIGDTDLELYGLRKDATEFPVEILLSPIETSDGVLVTSAIRDVTERRKAERALRRSKQRWRALVEHHPSAVFITVGGVVQYANPATASLFGAAESAALLGRSVFEFVPEDVHATIRERIAQLEGGEPTTPLQHKLIGDDGVTRVVEVNSVPIEYRGQQAVQTVGRDVTRRSRYEERLLEAKEEAERARAAAEEMNRLKSAFLANMSHEVRTPLASILGFAEALGEEVKRTAGDPPDRMSEMAAEFARLIQRSGERLLATLNSVLDLASLEAGIMGLHFEPADVAHEIRDTAALFRKQVEEADVRMHLDLAEDLVTELDVSAFHRILSNLLSNAIKFTDPGGHITIEADGDESHVWVVVEDTGVGISEDFLPELFDAFRQESTGISREHEGVGLGLAVTQQLVRLLNGTIEVESEKGVGTRFTVRLPRRRERGSVRVRG